MIPINWLINCPHAAWRFPILDGHGPELGTRTDVLNVICWEMRRLESIYHKKETNHLLPCKEFRIQPSLLWNFIFQENLEWQSHVASKLTSL